jgi:hypothetical protein
MLACSCVPDNKCVVCCCRRFDAAAFRAELKEVLRAAGVEGTPLLLFLEERHLADDPGEQSQLLLAVQTPNAWCVPAACWPLNG